MPRRTLQRIVRLSPEAARLAWGALPGGARSALSPLVHPIASGERQGAEPLSVPRPRRRARFDVVLGPGCEPSSALRARSVEAGQRVFVCEPEAFAALAREHAVLDAVLLDPRQDGECVRAARALGWRIASSEEELGPSFPEVTIVVATHAARELCESCLYSLIRSTGWPNYRVVVVDDGSHDGTREMLRRMARSEPALSIVRHDRRRGFPAACNAGLARATSEYVVLLNDDTVVAPGWLSRLVAHLERDERLALVCPVTNQIGNEARIGVSYSSLAEMEAFAVERASAHARERLDVDTLALFCVAARRETIEAAGGLDERYEVGLFEDDDLCMALRERGRSVAVALDAFVHHVGQATFGKLEDAEYLELWEANKRRFEDKWGRAWRPPGRRGNSG